MDEFTALTKAFKEHDSQPCQMTSIIHIYRLILAAFQAGVLGPSNTMFIEVCRDRTQHLRAQQLPYSIWKPLNLTVPLGLCCHLLPKPQRRLDGLDPYCRHRVRQGEFCKQHRRMRQKPYRKLIRFLPRSLITHLILPYLYGPADCIKVLWNGTSVISETFVSRVLESKERKVNPKLDRMTR